MKKMMLTVALMAATFAASAQTLIKANFQKGDAATYETVSEMTLNLPMGSGSHQVKCVVVNTLTVKDATAEGFLVEDLSTSLKSEGNEDMLEQVAGKAKYFLNVPILLQTDKNGAIKKIANYQDVIAKVSKVAIDDLNAKYAKKPEMEKVLPKAKAIMNLTNMFSEEAIIKMYKETNMWGLYGKTITNGGSDERVYNDVKGITTYELSNLLGTNAVVATTKANMTEEETKTFVLDQMKKQGANEEAIQQVSAHWNQMKAMGMDKIDMKVVETTHFQKNGWVSGNATDGTVKVMGTTIAFKVNAKMTNNSTK